MVLKKKPKEWMGEEQINTKKLTFTAKKKDRGLSGDMLYAHKKEEAGSIVHGKVNAFDNF